MINDKTKHLKYLHKIEEVIERMERVGVTTVVINKYDNIYRNLLRQERYKRIDDLMSRAEKVVEKYRSDEDEDTT